MDDSDDSMNLFFITRRRLLTGTATGAAAWPFQAKSLAGELTDGSAADPALRLCGSWQRIHDETLALCREQQRLETHLARIVGFPCAKVRLADGTDVTLHSIESLNDAHSPENEVEWGRALADFVAHQARWDAADAEIGYSRTDELIRQSETVEGALLDDLPQTAATSIEGILAKLKVILRDGEHWEHPDDFPWPHIRSVLNDLVRLHRLDVATNPSSEKQQNSQSR
ncbi:hypothetical protein X760_01360 [Mesorhizobium sp. LSHC422A00]|uniref:hypothetical protein n=1 Tax=unclassified Mesorhizobium TaxID=325217 RepID=UPI0003CE3B78|nr:MULTISPECIES: hypothetical protein [unclassified Mesorhizobium]ESW82151.1 hypothetical protein X773_12950 [Mesorhizobium sp. LSJC285A00]ESX63055.1 hypothetical protein X760_01360 [Mesorhizobium sp. LSHC422A00]ESZ09248.1 hypothetical protein X736_06235 [Mesorhizobium sp. L2C089B000]WJI53940.1 hypothetical protein NLY44_15435 [Mesorhizobium sp. C089B]